MDSHNMMGSKLDMATWLTEVELENFQYPPLLNLSRMEFLCQTFAFEACKHVDYTLTDYRHDVRITNTTTTKI